MSKEKAVESHLPLSSEVELPRYRSHKIVQAVKIESVLGNTIYPSDPDIKPFAVSGEYTAKHSPAAAGYFVRYVDGYESWSPADAFEDGYTLLGEALSGDFGFALTELRRGMSVARSGWNGKGQFLTLQESDAHSKMTVPYIYICNVQEDLVPWFPSQTDMLASDWVVVRPY